MRTLLTTRLTDRKQGVAGRRSHELNPVEGLWADLGILARNLATRLWPAAAAAERLRRRLAPVR